MLRFDFNPLKWARHLVFLALLALDYQHTYEFVLSYQTGAQAGEAVPIFGPLLAHAGISLSNGVFDAHAYAFTITATIYFMSNTLAKRLSRNHPALMYYTAMGVGVLVSALTNAGTMFYGATGERIIPAMAVGVTMAALGGIVTAGLVMFASMDAWDLKARYEKSMATRARNRAQRDEVAARRTRQEKFTPKVYRSAVTSS